MQIKSLAQQFTLFNTLSVFDSVPLSSFFSLFEDPVFSKSTAKSLGNNPSIFSPKLCSANPHFFLSDFHSMGKKETDKNTSCNCLSGMEAREVFPLLRIFYKLLIVSSQFVF